MTARISTFWANSTVNRRITLGLVTTATIALAVVARADYKDFLNLGPGGPPYNVFGWALVTLALRPFALNAKYATWTGDYPDMGASEEIRKLPERKGERAKIGGIAPHRQLSQYPGGEMREKLKFIFDNVQIQNPALLQTRLSHYEKHNSALYVHDSLLSSPETAKLPETAIVAEGEIGHMHPDLSVHLYFSPADAKIVIEKKWGERHRLARRRPWYYGGGMITFGLASTYLMVYGPRDDSELEVVRVLVRNSVKYMTAADDLAEF